VRLEAPFLRAVAACEALWSYSMCRSCRECFGGMGGPASSSTGRFTGMAGLESRCDGDRRRRRRNDVGVRRTAGLGWAGNFRLTCELDAGRTQESGESVWSEGGTHQGHGG